MARNENVFMARKQQYGEHPSYPVDFCRRRWRPKAKSRRPRLRCRTWREPAWGMSWPMGPDKGQMAAAIMAMAQRLGARR